MSIRTERSEAGWRVRADRSEMALWLAGGLTALFAFSPAMGSIRLFPSAEDYLAAHQVAEMFSIIVASLVFAVAWNAHERRHAANLSILSACFLGVALLDMGHTLSYRGMPVFVTPSGPEKAIAFWLAARAMAATGLLVAALRPWVPFRKRHSKPLLLVAVIAITGGVFWAVLWHLETLPRTYIPGEGLTTFKIAAEYVLIAAFLLASVLLLRRRDLRHRHWLASASFVLGLAGLFFTLYSDPMDIYNQFGHVYKIVAYGLLYRGLFIGTIREPYERLEQSRQRLSESEARTRAVIEGSMDAFVGFGEDGCLVFMNPAAERIFGLPAAEAMGRPVAETFISPSHHDLFAQRLAACWRSDNRRTERFDVEARRADGRRFLAEASLFPAGAGRAELMVACLRDVTELREAEIQERQRAAEIASLHQLGQRVGGALSLDEVVETALEEVLATVNPDLAMLFLRDADGKLVPHRRLARGTAMSSDAPEAAMGDCLCNRAAHLREPIYSLDLARDPLCRSTCLGGGLTSFAALPLTRGEEVLGVVAVATAGPRDFSRQARFLETMANEVSGFIQNAQLYDQLKARGEDLARANAGLEAEVAERRRAEEALKKARDELEDRVLERTRDLQAEVTERQFAEASLREAIATLGLQQEELRMAKEAADKANQAKSDFLSSMSHELRTPLNAILGFAQLLESGRPAPLTEKQQSYTRHIIKGGHHLLELINEVLDLARIEAGKLSLSPEPADPRPLLEECRTLARAVAGRNGVTVEDWQLPDELPRIQVDYTRFKQVLLNLMSNAVKYNRPGGRVTLAMEPGSPGTARFVVGDTGPGIAAEKQAAIFEPFNRLGAEATEIEGTGVGLTITKRLIEAMDGRIGFETEPGSGTTFWVEVPVVPDAVPHHPPALPAFMGTRGPAVTGQIGRARTLLYVEDNPANIQLMRELVGELSGFTLLTAHTAELALEIASVARPDVIVMDINLPGMSGIEAMRHLMDNKKTHAIPVIALSANVTQSAIRQGLEAGFRRYLLKPLDVAEFLAALDELMAVPAQ